MDPITLALIGALIGGGLGAVKGATDGKKGNMLSSALIGGGLGAGAGAFGPAMMAKFGAAGAAGAGKAAAGAAGAAGAPVPSAAGMGGSLMGKLAGLNWKGAGGSMLSNLMQQQGPSRSIPQPPTYGFDENGFPKSSFGETYLMGGSGGGIEPATTMMPLDLRY